jgi:hypothetical protein
MVEVQNKLDYAHAIADWFLELGDGHIHRGNFEDALKCNFIAGRILASQNRDLVSVRIESNLRLVAGRLAEQGMLQPDAPIRTGWPERCLHVLSEALPAGGHTAMASRWMKNDCSGRGPHRGVAFTGSTAARVAAAGDRRPRWPDSYSRPRPPRW